METESNYPSIANHLRRIIPAYIISNFLPFLQIWLGVEFSHFSKELKRAGETGDETLGKIAKYFLAAGVLTIFTFVVWLIPVILPYVTPYLSGHTITFNYYGYYELDYAQLLQYASIALPAIMGMIQTGILYKAWKQIRVFFSQKEQQRSYRSGGVQGAGRVIWAMDLNAFGYGMIVTGFILLAVAFGLNEYTSMGPLLSGLGEMLQFAGLINVGIGMGQTARGFQNLTHRAAPMQGVPMAAQQYQAPRPQYAGAPQVVFAPAPVPAKIKDPAPQAAEPPRPRFCSGCGAALPEAPGLKFCPTCGSSIVRGP